MNRRTNGLRAYGQMDRWREEQIDRQTEEQKHRKMNGQIDGQMAG
jgi:hypothetical protein